MTSRRTTAIGLTAGLLGGGAVGLVLGVPGLSSASGSIPAAVEQADDPTDDTTTDDTTDDTTDEALRADRTERLREVLQDLVDDGTLTAEQADAVATHLDEHMPARGGPDGGPGDGRGGPGHGRHGRPGFDGEVVAELLGIDVAELRAQLRDGASIADVAEANGVDVQTVIDALVAEASEHLALAVDGGRLTQEEADDKLADVTERITEMVERSRPIAGDTAD